MDADSVVYLTVEELQQCVGDAENFCTACFTGQYPQGSLPTDLPAWELLVPK
jgi:glutamine phosphoribosylpyrophosphate amidotransferase